MGNTNRKNEAELLNAKPSAVDMDFFMDFNDRYHFADIVVPALLLAKSLETHTELQSLEEYNNQGKAIGQHLQTLISKLQSMSQYMNVLSNKALIPGVIHTIGTYLHSRDCVRLRRISQKWHQCLPTLKNRIEFMGVFRDDGSRCMKTRIHVANSRTVFQTAVKYFAMQLRARGEHIGYMGLQFGSEIWTNVGKDAVNEAYNRLGLVPKSPRPNTQARGRVNLRLTVDGFEGRMDVVGGGWENAVYKIVVADTNEEYARLHNNPPTQQRIQYLGLWGDDGRRTLKQFVGHTHSQSWLQLLQQFVFWMRFKKERIGFFGLQNGNEMWCHCGQLNRENNYKRLSEVTIANLQGNGSNGVSLTFEGFDGVVDVIGGAWQNAVYSLELSYDDDDTPTADENNKKNNNNSNTNNNNSSNNNASKTDTDGKVTLQ